eukprot:43143-Pleurochrysis_carterae.AAC.1
MGEKDCISDAGWGELENHAAHEEKIALVRVGSFTARGRSAFGWVRLRAGRCAGGVVPAILGARDLSRMTSPSQSSRLEMTMCSWRPRRAASPRPRPRGSSPRGSLRTPPTRPNASSVVSRMIGAGDDSGDDQVMVLLVLTIGSGNLNMSGKALTQHSTREELHEQTSSGESPSSRRACP